jgi:hypothetical protein
VIFPAHVLAHQGGWDEMLMVLVPILIFAVLLVVANRRASRIGEQQSLAADGAGVRPVGGVSAGTETVTGGGNGDGDGDGHDADDGGGGGGNGGAGRSGGGDLGGGAERRRSDGRAGP